MRAPGTPPAFSIVVPAYNAAGTIEAAVSSVLAQTRADFELIVVDDGSSDDTARRAASLGDRRVLVVRQANGGTSAALNAGVARARAPFISILGADDLYLPTYLEEMEQTLASAPEAGFAYTDAWNLDARSHRIQHGTAMSPERPPVPPPSDPAQFLAELLERNFVFGLAMIRRSALDRVGPFDPSLRNGQDYEMWLRLVAHGFRGVRTQRLLAVYRRRAGSLSSNLIGGATARCQIYRLVAEEYDVPEPVRALARRRLSAAEAEVETLRAWQARRRLVPVGVRRVIGRAYRAARSRGAWYEVPPPEVAAAFPDLSSL